MYFTCDNYDLAESKLKAFSRSAMRTKVMLCLLEKERDAKDIGNEIGIRSTTIHHSITEMVEEKLVAKTDTGYGLTNLGRVQALLLEKLLGTIVAIDQHEDFWLNHDLRGIPLELQKNIGMLVQSEVIASDSSAPLRAYENFLAELGRAEEIHGVSPVIYPGNSEAIARAVERGALVDLILTREILQIVASEYKDILKALLKHRNFRLYSIDAEVKEAFTVTDTLLSLGLFRLNGDYDIGNDLICKGEGARKWGMELFNHYLIASRQVVDI